MRGIWFHEGGSGCEVRPANLPFRPDGVKGSLADINARAVWLTRSPTPRDLCIELDRISIVLSGDVLYRYASTTQPLGRGDFAYLDVASDSVKEMQGRCLAVAHQCPRVDALGGWTGCFIVDRSTSRTSYHELAL